MISFEDALRIARKNNGVVFTFCIECEKAFHFWETEEDCRSIGPIPYAVFKDDGSGMWYGMDVRMKRDSGDEIASFTIEC